MWICGLTILILPGYPTRSPLAAAGSPINDTSHFSLSCRNQSYLDICSLDTLLLAIICSVLKERDSRSEDRPDTVLMWDWLCLRLEGGPGLLTGCYWHRLVTGLEKLGECSCLGLIFHSSKTTVNNIKWMSKATPLCQPAGNTWVREEDLG